MLYDACTTVVIRRQRRIASWSVRSEWRTRSYIYHPNVHSFKEPEIKKTELKSSGRITAVRNFNETFEAAEGMAARKRLYYNDYITMFTYICDKLYIQRARRDGVRSIDKNFPKQNNSVNAYMFQKYGTYCSRFRKKGRLHTFL